MLLWTHIICKRSLIDSCDAELCYIIRSAHLIISEVIFAINEACFVFGSSKIEGTYEFYIHS